MMPLTMAGDGGASILNHSFIMVKYSRSVLFLGQCQPLASLFMSFVFRLERPVFPSQRAFVNSLSPRAIVILSE
jgi:hypothetical protein